MKQITNTLLLASLLLVGCTSYEAPEIESTPPSAEEYTTPLDFESAMLSMEDATRATTETLEEGTLGIFVSGFILWGDQLVTSCSNVPYKRTKTSGRWSPDNTKPLYLGPLQVPLTAYYPYKSDRTNMNAISLQSGKYAEANDLSYAFTQMVNNANDVVNLNLRRAYARLKIQFVGQNLAGTPLKVTKVTLKHLLSSTTLHIGKGIYASTAGVLNGGCSDNSKSVSITATGNDRNVWGDFLLIPCTPYQGKTLIELQVGSKLMTAEVAYTPVAGEYKGITVRINQGALSVEVSKLDWTNQTASGDYPLYP